MPSSEYDHITPMAGIRGASETRAWLYRRGGWVLWTARAVIVLVAVLLLIGIVSNIT